MLRLDKITMAGFKSFCDRTELRVESGITAIVGPNGCGKSNLGDAINWVLGSQSARSMRGGRMGDLIFNGTRERKPVGMAEVSLQLLDPGSNGNGGEHVQVTRRLYRSGDSDYEINGKRCRLKDIKQMLDATGLGTGSSVIIAQGKVDQLVSAAPRDRRLVIEEAAGLAGYKLKRRNAEAKLEAAESNLNRVNDILSEVERQMRSLKRQAGRARRFRRLMDSIRERQVWLYTHRYRDLVGRHAELADELDSAQERERDSVEAVEDGVQETQALRAQIAEADAEVSEVRGRLHELQRESDVGTDRIRSHRERIRELEREIEAAGGQSEQLQSRARELADQAGGEDERLDQALRGLDELEVSAQRAEGELEGLEKDVKERAGRLEELMHRRLENVQQHSELRNRYTTLVERLDTLRKERERLGAETTRAAEELEALETLIREQESRLEGAQRLRLELQGRLERAKAGRHSAQSELAATEHALRTASQQQAVLEERLAALRRLDREDPSGGGEYLRSLVEQRNGDAPVRLAGLVLDQVEVDPEVERAAEAYLSPWLTAGVLSEGSGPVEAVSWLRSEGAGQLHLLSPTAEPPASDATALPATLEDDAEVLGPLSRYCRMPDEVRHALATVTPDPVVVRTFEAAVRLGERHPELCFLTVEGDLVRAPGWIRAAGSHDSGGTIARHREAADLAARLTHLASEEMLLAARCAGLRGEVETSGQLMERLQSERQQAEREEYGATVLLDRSRDEMQRKQRRIEQCEIDRHHLEDELRENEQALTELGTREQDQAALVDRHAQDIDVVRSDLEQARAHADGARERALGLRREVSAARQQREEVRIEVERSREASRLARLQIEELSRSSEEKRDKSSELAREVETLESSLGELGTAVEEHSSRLAAGEAALAELRQRLTYAESALETARTAQEEMRSRFSSVQIRLAELESDRKHLEESWTRDTERSPDDLPILAGVAPQEPEAEELAESQVAESPETAAVEGTPTDDDGPTDAVPEAEAESASADGEPAESIDDESTEAEAVAPETPPLAPLDFDALPETAADPELCEAELRDLRSKLEALGPVNMMAIEEFEELDTRAEFLYGQRQDILDAIESLRNTIRRINRTSRERFTEAFEAIQQNFRDLYGELFEGGRADLRLEDEQDVLESGLEVVAQPPGKRLQSIHLLSGGEKALTALALLFAVFKFRPAPFCVLDEVDAPLDDANVDRFTRLLRLMSQHTQFLMVTHNRRSMESADLMYGVTMAEPGVSSLLSMKLN